MLEQLRQVNMILAAFRQNVQELLHENEELRKRYTALQKDYDKMKNEYDECKRNLEKTSQETSDSTDKTTSVNEVPTINSITSKNVDPAIYTIANCTDGKIKFYDGGGSTQLVAEH